MLTQEVCKKVYEYINQYEIGVSTDELNEKMGKEGFSKDDVFGAILNLVEEEKVFIGFNKLGIIPQHLFFTNKYKKKNFKL